MSQIGDYIYLTWEGYEKGEKDPNGNEVAIKAENAITNISTYHKNLLKKYRSNARQHQAKMMQSFLNENERKDNWKEYMKFKVEESIVGSEKDSFYTSNYSIDKNLRATINTPITKEDIDKRKKGMDIFTPLKTALETVQDNLKNEVALNQAALQEIFFNLELFELELNRFYGVAAYSTFDNLQKRVKKIRKMINNVVQQSNNNSINRGSKDMGNIFEQYNILVKDFESLTLSSSIAKVHGIAGEHFIKEVVPEALKAIIKRGVENFESDVVGSKTTRKGIDMRRFSSDISMSDFTSIFKDGDTKTIRKYNATSKCLYNIRPSQNKVDVTVSYEVDGKNFTQTFSVKNYSQKFLKSTYSDTHTKKSGHISIVSGTNLLTIIGAQDQAEGHNDFINHWINLTGGKYKEGYSFTYIEEAKIPSNLLQARKDAMKTMRLLIAAKALIGDTTAFVNGEKINNNAVDYFVFHDLTNGKTYVQDVGTILDNIDKNTYGALSIQGARGIMSNKYNWALDLEYYYARDSYKNRITRLISKMFQTYLYVSMHINVLGRGKI